MVVGLLSGRTMLRSSSPVCFALLGAVLFGTSLASAQPAEGGLPVDAAAPPPPASPSAAPAGAAPVAPPQAPSLPAAPLEPYETPHAAEPTVEPAQAAPAEAISRRVFGVGVGVGGGICATEDPRGRIEPRPVIYLPTIETQIFIPGTDGMSVDISLPISNILFNSAVLGFFYWQTDAFFNFGPGGRTVRLVAGPGIGFDVYGYGPGGIRLLGEIGVEALTRGQGFSFKFLARPFFSGVFMADDDGLVLAARGGVSGILSWSGNYVK